VGLEVFACREKMVVTVVYISNNGKPFLPIQYKDSRSV